jgi:hypothetical protein
MIRVIRKVVRMLASRKNIALKPVNGQTEKLRMVGKETLLTGTVMLIAGTSMAYTSPAGGWAQDVYDMVVTNIVQGPIGFSAGVGVMVAGALAFIFQRLAAGVICCGAGAMLLNAEELVTSTAAVRVPCS